MADQSIELTAYDPTWPVRFAEQQTRLAGLLRPWLAGEIEHVGSTSVRGLRSKPIVDILAPVQSLAASRAAIPVLEKDGWLFWPDDPNYNYRLWSCDRALRRALITCKSSNMIIQIFEH